MRVRLETREECILSNPRELFVCVFVRACVDVFSSLPTDHGLPVADLGDY